MSGVDFGDETLRAKVMIDAPDAAERLARSLLGAGFHIVETSPTGVYIEGARRCYESAFQVRVSGGPGHAQMEGTPRFSALDGGERIRAVYFPRPVQHHV